MFITSAKRPSNWVCELVERSNSTDVSFCSRNRLLRVGSSSSADRPADLRPVSEADLRRKTVGDCFGRVGPFERASTYGGCTLKPVVGVPIFRPIG